MVRGKMECLAPVVKVLDRLVPKGSRGSQSGNDLRPEGSKRLPGQETASCFLFLVSSCYSLVWSWPAWHSLRVNGPSSGCDEITSSVTRQGEKEKETRAVEAARQVCKQARSNHPVPPPTRTHTPTHTGTKLLYLIMTQSLHASYTSYKHRQDEVATDLRSCVSSVDSIYP